jgi:SAM-dependent methyltransferase
VNSHESKYVEKKGYHSRYTHERMPALRDASGRLKGQPADPEEWMRTLKDELPRFVPFLTRKCCVEFSGRILEIGAGGAWLSAELSKLPKVVEIITTDLSPKLLKEEAPQVFRLLGAHTAKITRMPADFHALQFPDNHFDFVVCSAVLQHAANIVQVLREAKRVLKPGGRFIAIREPVWPLVKLKSRASMIEKLVATGCERALSQPQPLPRVLQTGGPAPGGPARRPLQRTEILPRPGGQRHHPRPLRLHRHQARPLAQTPLTRRRNRAQTALRLRDG